MDRTQTQSKTQSTGKAARVAFIRARWHSGVVDEACASFTAEMDGLTQGGAEVEVLDVPGAFEIPLLAKRLAALVPLPPAQLFALRSRDSVTASIMRTDAARSAATTNCPSKVHGVGTTASTAGRYDAHTLRPPPPAMPPPLLTPQPNSKV